MIDVVWKPRSERVGQLVQDCADGKLSFDDLCKEVDRLGFSTRYLYEAVRNAERRK